MAPQPHYIFNQSLTDHTAPLWSPDTFTISAPSSSSTPETITNVFFGLCALGIGSITIWQGRRAWNVWKRCDQREMGTNDSHVELGPLSAASPSRDPGGSNIQRNDPASLGDLFNDPASLSGRFPGSEDTPPPYDNVVPSGIFDDFR